MSRADVVGTESNRDLRGRCSPKLQGLLRLLHNRHLDALSRTRALRLNANTPPAPPDNAPDFSPTALESRPGFILAPEGHGTAERCTRIPGAQPLWRDPSKAVTRLRLALQQWRKQHNTQWPVQRHGHRTPEQLRQTRVALRARSLISLTLVSGKSGAVQQEQAQIPNPDACKEGSPVYTTRLPMACLLVLLFSLLHPSLTQAQSAPGVCDRTPQVRDWVVAQVDEVDNCAAVTTRHLQAISGDMDLADENIRALKAGDFQSLSVADLSLHDNRLITLPSGVFNGLMIEGALDLSDNQITTLPADVFNDLTISKGLILDRNRLTTLPVGVFNGLQVGENLSLANNLLATLPAGVFSGLLIGGNLDLSDNQLATLPAHVFNGLRVNELFLDNNRLQTLPDYAFRGLHVQGSLRLRGNRLSTMPSEVFDGLVLDQSLFLQNNRLSTLPANVFDGLILGRALSLQGNQLTVLPAGVFTGLSAEVINLHDNQLTTLPGKLFNGLGVGDVNLSKNQLTRLPDNLFVGLETIRYLDLLNNPGASFPLTVELERTDAAPYMPGPATAVLKLAEGAPLEIEVPLTVSGEGGSLSTQSATIAAGMTTSAPVTITGTMGMVTVELDMLPRLSASPETTIFGLELISGAPLILFGMADTTGPVINSASINSNPGAPPNYLAGESIEITVTFSEPVHTTGSPRFALLIGTEVKYARYVSDRQGMSVLLFRYQVREGDMDGDGISWSADPLELNGGSIQDRAGNDATLTLSTQSADATHQVNAPALELSFGASSYRATECAPLDNNPWSCGTATAVIEVRLNSAPVVSPFIIPLLYNPTGGADTTDYQAYTTQDQAVGGTVRFGIGETTRPLYVNALLDDDISESAEGVSISFDTLPAGVLVVGTSTTVVQFSELPIVTLTPPTSVGEDSGRQGAMLTASVPAPAGGLSVGYRLSITDADSATLGIDLDNPLSLAPTTSIEAGMTSGTVRFTILEDDIYEGDETFTISLVAPGGAQQGTYQLGMPASVSITIVDNDMRPGAFGLATTVDRLAEEQNTATDVTVTATLMGSVSLSTATVFTLVLTGTAIPGTDYTLGGPLLITIPPGMLSAATTLNLTPGQDTITEGSETIILTASADKAFLGPARIVTLTLTDDDAATAEVCNRTPQVRDWIVARVAEIDNCAAVTIQHLEAISGDMDLADENIRALKAGDFQSLSVAELSIRGNRLITLPSGVFNGLHVSGSLRLEQNQITTLPAGVFNNLMINKGLSLDGNRLTTLPVGIFNGLQVGENLSLANNLLATLPAGVFSGLLIGGNLDLSDNQLATLPAHVFNGLRVNELFLDNNRLQTLPDYAFRGLHVQGSLRLRGNRLSTMPSEVFDGLVLDQSLFLQNNRLTTLPANVFDGLILGRALSLQGNQLTVLPAGVFTGLSAEVINLHDNQLTTLPGKLFNGLGVGDVNLSKNQLTRLPDNLFVGLETIRYLDLLNNPGASFPLTVELERTDAAPYMPGPATAVLKLAEGAPLEIEVPLTVSGEGGSLSTQSATIAAGMTTSAPVTITGTMGMVTVELDMLPRLSASPEITIFGLELISGAPLILFGMADTTGPVINSASINSNPGAPPNYLAGESIEITVTFSEPVHTTGSPRFALLIGTEVKYARYVSDRQGMSVLLFRYQVREGDMDGDGISWSADPLELNGGSIQDRAGNDATLTLSTQSADATHQVNAPALELSFGASSYRATECAPLDNNPWSCGTATAVIEVRLNSAPVVSPFIIPLLYNPTGGADSTDYQAYTTQDQAVGGTVRFGIGETTRPLYVNALLDDDISESAEGVSISFDALPAGVRAVGTSTTVVQFAELPVVTLTPISVGEGSGLQGAMLTASVPAPAGGLSVGYRLSITDTDSAMLGMDFDNPPSLAPTASIEAGMTSGTVRFTILEDDIYEGDETFTISLVAPGGAQQGTYQPGIPASISVTIVDNDMPPNAFELEATMHEFAEENDSPADVTLTVTLTGGASLPTDTVFTLAVTGTATLDTDYTLSPLQITIPPGMLSADITLSLTPTQDTIAEGDETIILTASADKDFLGAAQMVTLTLTDDDTRPDEFELEATMNEFAEGDESATDVTLTARLGGEVSLPTATVFTLAVTGTATLDTDYTLSPLQITIPPGMLSADITLSLTPTQDTIAEGSETIILTASADKDFLGTAQRVTLTLTDDDTQPNAFELTAAVDQITEEQNTAADVTLTVTLMGGASLPTATVFTLAVTGTATLDTDYTLSPLQITIPPGMLSADTTLSLTPTQDTIAEGDETIILTASADKDFLGAAQMVTLTLTDDDMPPNAFELTATVDQITEEQNIAANVTVTAKLVGEISLPTDTVFTLALTGTATLDTDYALDTHPLQITISPGMLSANTTLRLTPTQDTIAEGDETIILTASADKDFLGAAQMVTLTLTDDDMPPDAFELEATVNEFAEGDESAANVTVTAKLVGEISLPTDTVFTLALTGTATQGTDYALDTHPLQITISPGMLSANTTLRLTPTQDTIAEGDETIILTASADKGFLGTAQMVTLTLTDDDMPPNAFELTATVDQITEEQNTATDVMVTARLVGEASLPTDTVFTLALTGTATQGTDYALDTHPLLITIPPGTLSAATILRLTPTQDTIAEGDETIILTASTDKDFLSTAQMVTLSLTDDDTRPDAFELEATVNEFAEGNESATDVMVTARLVGEVRLPTDTVFTLALTGTATQGTDYALDTHPLLITIPPGILSANTTLSLTPTQDTIAEGDETIILTASADKGFLGTAQMVTLTLTDDDMPPNAFELTATVDQITEEQNTATDVTVTATLVGSASLPTDTVFTLVLTGTAIPGTDYTREGPLLLTIPPGTLSAATTLSLTPTQDTIAEGNETIILTASADKDFLGTAQMVTLTLTDDDAATAEVCNRTPQVRDWIVAKVAEIDNCAAVTIQHLEAISGDMDLADANIRALKAGDFQFLSVADLSLRSNQLITLPSGVFNGLHVSGSMRLEQNQITTLPAGVFNNLMINEGLSLDGNRLTTLPVGIFNGLQVGEDLSLANNLLATLPAGVFSGLLIEGQLDLSDNQLATLPADVFDGLSLRHLFLQSNRLAVLPAGLFSNSAVSQTIDLSANQLNTLPRRRV